MRTIILLALVGAVFTEPTSPIRSQRIVGGTDTNVETYPFISQLQFLHWNDVFVHGCGGTLITENSVLTAAHCVGGIALPSMRVILGTSIRNSGGTVFIPAKTILHPEFDSSSYLVQDIAIIRLSSIAVLSNTVGLARVAGANYILPDNTPVVTLGWGRLWTLGPNPEQLQHVQVDTVNQQICAERYDYLRTFPDYYNFPIVTPDMLCAGILDIGGKDACQGDSGGPLVHNRDILVGVVSWGFECAESYWPGVYSRVNYNLQWILNNT